MNIRQVQRNDAAAICGIYNYYVEHTAVTFDTVLLPDKAMESRIRETLQAGLPFYVAEQEGEIRGYCYIHQWDKRQAYSSTKEITVYLRPGVQGRGIGTQLLSRLLPEIDRRQTHVLIAGICLPNEASVRLHEKFGFRQVSCMKQIGFKLGEWQDVGHWQLIIE